MNRFPAPTAVRLPDAPGRRDIVLSTHALGSGPAVVCCHGFPELAYSWRHQLPALAAAGFRAIAPDQRGYGRSSRPAAIEAYGIGELTGDLVGLLDALEIERAVFVGHDWGGLVAWAMPVLHPDRTAGVIGICTPYIPFVSVDLMRAMVDGDTDRHYIAWFQQPGVAEAVMDRNVETLFRRLMRGGVPPEEVLRVAMADGKLNMNPFRDPVSAQPLGELIVDPDELAYYCDAFARTGFGGGINWYRNIDRNAREHPNIGHLPLALPCLMVTAEWDVALTPALAAHMPQFCSDLETHMIERGGHWVQQEKPDAVNRVLVDWLTRRFGTR